jgi:hypothetical protein
MKEQNKDLNDYIRRDTNHNKNKNKNTHSFQRQIGGRINTYRVILFKEVKYGCK